MTRLRHAWRVVCDLSGLAAFAALYAACSVGERRRRARAREVGCVVAAGARTTHRAGRQVLADLDTATPHSAPQGGAL